MILTEDSELKDVSHSPHSSRQETLRLKGDQEEAWEEGAAGRGIAELMHRTWNPAQPGLSIVRLSSEVAALTTPQPLRRKYRNS